MTRTRGSSTANAGRTDGFVLGDELEQLRDTLRAAVDEVLIPLEREETDDGTLAAPAVERVHRLAHELGIWAAGVPAELGGAGLSPLAAAIVTEELSRTTLWPHIAHLGEPLPALYAGTDEQRQRYLLPAIRGERIGAFALTETAGGADPAGNTRTTARPESGGWILDGRKVFVSRGSAADHFVVLARTGRPAEPAGITAFLVDADTPGVTHVRRIRTMGSQTPSEIVFDGCRIDDGQRLGGVGEGFAIAQRTLGAARSWIGSHAVGTATRLLELAVAYVPTRTAFGQPVSRLGMAQAPIADCAIEIEACRWLTYHAVSLAARGRDTRTIDSQVKVFASEMLSRVADRVLQLHGGWGYSTDLPIERFYRDTRMWQIVEGPNEVHRYAIARALMRPATRTERP